MISRRQFLKGIALAAAAPRAGIAGPASRFGRLVADPARVLDLPAGFEYTIVARAGTPMSDGLLVPGLADGMAAFSGDDNTVVLVCNHENNPANRHQGPFGPGNELLGRFPAEYLYDAGGGLTPGTGGTTTIVYEPARRRTVRQHLSLAGTEVNCAGGPTPWGSWLSCEESFSSPDTTFEYGRVVRRERRHGYVFEVPAAATAPVDPVPLTAMGRFEHEAAAVDPSSGIVYLTEDRHESLFYRYLPNVRGRLAEGGRLQALAVEGRASFDTRNWSAVPDVRPGQWLPVRWIDLDDPDNDDDDLRFRGFEAGAACFARGEGLCTAEGSFFFTATIGGPERLGQVFEFRPGRRGGGRLRLIAQSTAGSLLRNADNVTMSPWGDLIICEDTAEHCGLVGMTPDGDQYALADNAYTNAELAGVCFSPGGDVLFVNLQQRGLTLAITGPWPRPA